MGDSSVSCFRENSRYLLVQQYTSFSRGAQEKGSGPHRWVRATDGNGICLLAGVVADVADDLGDLGKDFLYGFGALDVNAFLL